MLVDRQEYQRGLERFKDATEHLQFIADSIEKYRIDLIHATTCQTIQFHNLTKETVYFHG